MFKQMNHRVYALPLMLFIFLAVLFVSAGVYIKKEEKSARISKAQSVAEQVMISLEVFSTERIQAVTNLMRTWPSFEPNKKDWFNAQAMSLMGMQRGFSSLVYINSDRRIEWVATPPVAAKTRISNALIGKPMASLGMNVDAVEETFNSTLIYSELTQHHYMLIGRSISPQEPEHGYIVAGFDVQTILGVMLGELVGPQFNFKLTTQEEVLFQNGEFVSDGTRIALPEFQFLERPISLSMQSQLSPYNPGMLVIAVGLLMSVLVSYIFHKQLKGAVRLSDSQQRYVTASEASLDALLIYQPNEGDYVLVESNSHSAFIFRGVIEKLKVMTLAQQAQFLALGDILTKVAHVTKTGTPYEAYVAVENKEVIPDWLKVQVVKAGDNIAITVRDVSERFKAQQDLAHSEERYRRLVDGMRRHFVYTKKSNHRFAYVSAGVEELLGYEPDDFCNNEPKFVRQIPDETLEIRRLIASGQKPPPYLVRYANHRGRECIIEFSDTPILDENKRIIAIEGIARDVTEELALQEKVTFQANHDQLTGLLNRYAFDATLRNILKEIRVVDNLDTGSVKNEISLAEESTGQIQSQIQLQPSPQTGNTSKESVMCFIDMDRFKLVNDSCGHPAGDKLLREVAGIFENHVRSYDLLARIGGDEFCIIFKNQCIDDVKKRLDNLLESISNYRFFYDDKMFFIGASIGVIEINGNTKNAESLIKAADNACYKAKQLGRNRYVIHSDSDNQNAIDDNENSLLQTLHRALQHDGFELFSQAIMPLFHKNASKTTHLQHYEILLRLRNEAGDLVSPGLFIPLAERHGLMSKVDMWVVKNTIRILEAHPSHLDNVGKVAINLSGITLGDDVTLQKIAQLIQSTIVPAEKICFEITETTAVTNLNAARDFISTLRDLGCSFALDDFGAGMSSFTYLKNLDVDYVKIDGSFVRNIVYDPIDRATVTAINNIAHSMGKKTVAEFVVDEATTDVLRELQVDFGQGFALDKPKPLAHRVQWRVKLASA